MSSLTFWKLNPPMYDSPSSRVLSIVSNSVNVCSPQAVTPNRQPSFSRATTAGVSRLLGVVVPSRSPMMNWMAPR